MQVSGRGTVSLEEIKYFFSYAREDSEFVLKLAKELRVVGAKFWLDQLDILGGERWDRAVEGALGSCQGMIAVLSPESLDSNNVMDEVSYALEEGKLIVPILLRSCVIPFRLRRVQHIDFTDSYEMGFSQLLRALRIDQPSQPTKFAALEEPILQDDTKPLEAKPVKAPVTERLAGAVSGYESPHRHTMPPEGTAAAPTPIHRADVLKSMSGGNYKETCLRMFETSKVEWRNTFVWLGLTLGGLIIGLIVALPFLHVVVDRLESTMNDEVAVATFLCAICGGTVGFTQWIWLKKRVDVGPSWVFWSFVILATLGFLLWELGFALSGLFAAIAIALVQGLLMKQSHTILPSVLLQASPWLVALLVEQIVAYVLWPGNMFVTIIGVFLTSLVWMPLNAVVMISHLKRLQGIKQKLAPNKRD
jgi:TIR domain